MSLTVQPPDPRAQLPATFLPSDPSVRGGDTHPTPPAAAPSPLALRLDDGRELPLDRRITVGSAADSDLVLADRHVSARHCTFALAGGRVVVQDRGSCNGTFVGGVRVTSGELRPGLRVTVGMTELLVVARDRPEEGVFVGRSAALRRLRHELGRVAPARAPVLLLGESGTGKELAARTLHAASGRAGAFVAVNCGAIAAELAESELFGHEKGAFTGASGRRRGFFEEAHGGTLFLDEIGALPLALQPKLLRALETQMIRPVGGAGERRVDVRVVAATQPDIEDAVAAGRFRLDLYHRLATIVVRLPPLRERPEDIPALAHHFLVEHDAVYGSSHTLSPAALEALVGAPWPGNVRELKNALERAVLLGTGELQPEDLLQPAGPARAYRYELPAPAGQGLLALERDAIADALRRSGGSRRAAAQALGVPKSTLCDKVRRYGIAVDGPDVRKQRAG